MAGRERTVIVSGCGTGGNGSALINQRFPKCYKQPNLENIIKVLTEMEVDQVSGSGAGRAIAKAGVVTGSAAIGTYIGAARLGATLGMAAGPVGAVAGAMIGAGIVYMYYGA